MYKTKWEPCELLRKPIHPDKEDGIHDKNQSNSNFKGWAPETDATCTQGTSIQTILQKTRNPKIGSYLNASEELIKISSG